MARLRARHWLAVTLAAGLLVFAFTYGSNDADDDQAGDLTSTAAAGDTDADEGAERPDADDGERPDELARADDGGDSGGSRAPLTGLPVSPEVAERPALMVKVDNHPRARPQTGLDLADLVFEVRAEGITRFAAVFQSELPEPVGPVRSSRTSDFDLLRGLDTPLYASSGGNDYVTNGLRSLPIVELTNRTRTEYFRDFSRVSPHNLYVNGRDLYALVDSDELPTPVPWFGYGPPERDLPDTAVAATGPVRIAYTGSPLVTHEWDESVGGWLRTQDGAPHLTVDGDQLAPENVAIFITDYTTSPADAISPEVRSVGRGSLVVLTAGHIITGTWERETAESKPVLTDDDGEAIVLTAGRTWVLMPETGQVSFASGQDVTLN
jgi:hypothetical protein